MNKELLFELWKGQEVVFLAENFEEVEDFLKDNHIVHVNWAFWNEELTEGDITYIIDYNILIILPGYGHSESVSRMLGDYIEV